jgi:hypothetical protein
MVEENGEPGDSGNREWDWVGWKNQQNWVLHLLYSNSNIPQSLLFIPFSCGTD